MGFPNAIKQATLAIVDDRTIKWKNVPGLLTTSDSVLNLFDHIASFFSFTFRHHEYDWLHALHHS